MDQDKAAAKIQALHRGTNARKEARVIRAEKERCDAAAVRIQAIQRGRFARERAQQVRSDATLIRLPAELETSEYVVMRMQMETLRRRVDTWEAFCEAVQDVMNGRPFGTTQVLYSTEEKAPEAFANALTKDKFLAIKEFDNKRREADKARKENDEVEAVKAAEAEAERQKPPPPPLPEGEEPPPPPQKTKKQMREEADKKKAEKERVQRMVNVEYEVQCLAQKLQNLLKLKYIRVDVVSAV